MFVNQCRRVLGCIGIIILSGSCVFVHPEETTVSNTVSAQDEATSDAFTYLPIVTKASPETTTALPLTAVKFWAYQIQNVSEPGMVAALAAPPYDMLILEPTRTDWSSDNKYFDTQEMVTQLQATKAGDGRHRKLVLAYIDIGEAEDWRWYWTWSTGWDCQSAKPADWPDYILSCDPDGWAGNYPVAYWDPAWQDLVIYGQTQATAPYRNYTSMIDEVIKDGFDGIYLDWVEAFENEDVMAAAAAANIDPATAMIDFIQEMRLYAQARNPDFLIIQQNAAALIDGHPELTQIIDAIAQEAVWYDGDATDHWDDPNGYDFENDPELVNYYLDYLSDYQAAGLPVFACEYALLQADTAYALAYARGFVPYVTRRSLGRLTTTPPPGMAN